MFTKSLYTTLLYMRAVTVKIAVTAAHPGIPANLVCKVCGTVVDFPILKSKVA